PGDLLPPAPARMSLSFSKPAGTNTPLVPPGPTVPPAPPPARLLVPVRMQPTTPVPAPGTGQPPMTGQTPAPIGTQPQAGPPTIRGLTRGEASLSSEYASPGPERVFGRLMSEDDLQEMLRQKDKQDQFRGDPSQTDRATFPPKRPLTSESYQPRALPGVTVQV